MDYRTIIFDVLKSEHIQKQDIIKPPSDLADFCLPCFKLSKAFKKSPDQIALELSQSVAVDGFEVSALKGYLNFTLTKKRLVEDVLLSQDSFENEFSGKTVCIDYSSVNIAKPFHIGHLMSTAIGGSLYKIFKYLGANTIGINHLGDWGTQFGHLITAYQKWGDEKRLNERGLDELLELYVRIQKEIENDSSLADLGRAAFKRIEDGSEYEFSLFKKFKDITLKEVQKVYQRLNITFDSYNGESFFNDKTEAVIKLLDQKNLTEVSDGAVVVNLDKYDMPPALIKRSDGASLYITRDLAAAIYRKNTYNFDKCLYVVAYQQNLHFKQLFKVLELADFDWAKDCVHAAFGMVSLPGGMTLKTRSGNVVFLNDVLNAAAARALEIIQERNPALENKQETAEKVGVGAVVFDVLYNTKIKDVVFSLEKALNFEGETGPYVQYTYARCCSVLKKAGEFSANDLSSLYNDDAAEVLKVLSGFNDALINAALNYEPYYVSRYLIRLAQAFNRYYMYNRIITEDKTVSAARLLLTKKVREVLKTGLELILLAAPEVM